MELIDFNIADENFSKSKVEKTIELLKNHKDSSYDSIAHCMERMLYVGLAQEIQKGEIALNELKEIAKLILSIADIKFNRRF